ncbi:MAG: hypothetical protein IJ064_07110 [Bacteroidaceae bacterium]|nr:hypothetical protein [Bacteroidaceae bacterium]
MKGFKVKLFLLDLSFITYPILMAIFVLLAVLLCAISHWNVIVSAIAIVVFGLALAMALYCMIAHLHTARAHFYLDRRREMEGDAECSLPVEQ